MPLPNKQTQTVTAASGADGRDRVSGSEVVVSWRRGPGGTVSFGHGERYPHNWYLLTSSEL
jgi:hypothetical protein